MVEGSTRGQIAAGGSPDRFQVQDHSDARSHRGIVIRDHLALLESISGIQRSRRLPGLVYPQLDELAALLSQALLNVGYELLSNALPATSFYHTDLMQKSDPFWRTYTPHMR